MGDPGAVGGPLAVDFSGTVLTPLDRERLAHPAVGVVILFARNFASVEQLAELTAQLHGLRGDPAAALRVAVDHEGGRVQRFREGFTPLPPMAALGRCWDADVLRACRGAFSVGLVLATELRAAGVDLSFAPVLDLDWGRSGVIGDRALHRDARVVTVLASQLMHGMRAAGMANCGKHFPGHGWAAADSHHAVPVDDRPLDQILADDAAPYAWLGPALAGVMPAHVVYPQVDASAAGFSRIWIEQVLRGRLGFGGAVFSDDLCMAGARAAGDVPAAAAAALAAGCDFILVCNDEVAADQVRDRLRWQPTAAFAARRAGLLPRGAVGRARSGEALATPALAQARRDVARLHDEAPSRA